MWMGLIICISIIVSASAVFFVIKGKPNLFIFELLEKVLNERGGDNGDRTKEKKLRQ
jgi:hypothetical protein